MDTEKQKIGLIRKYLDILDEHYNVTTYLDLETDGIEYICLNMPDEIDAIPYLQEEFLDYMSDISSFRKVDNTTVRTKHIRQTIIDTPRHGSEYIETRLSQYVYRGSNYQVKVVSKPLLIGLYNSKKLNCDDNCGIFPCSGYLALELRYSDNNKLTVVEENQLLERILYDLTLRIGEAVYISTFIDMGDVWEQMDKEYSIPDTSPTVIEVDVDSLNKPSEMLNLYRQAKEIKNPEIAFLLYYKIIEFVSQAVAKKNAFESLNNHLNLPDEVARDYHYLDTILGIASQYRDDQKDDYLMNSVIQACIDVKPEFNCLPISLQKQIKINLGIGEDVDICAATLDPKQEISLKRQVASILYSTRNSMVHAKANYTPSGLECPSDTLEDVNQMMDKFALTLIAWNEAQPDYLRV